MTRIFMQVNSDDGGSAERAPDGADDAILLHGRQVRTGRQADPAGEQFIRHTAVRLVGIIGGGREEGLAKLGRQVPLGRVGEPDDVAWGALYLVSDEAKFVTGHGLYIDGGISAQ